MRPDLARRIQDGINRLADTVATLTGPHPGDPVVRADPPDGRHLPLLDCQHPGCIAATASIPAMLAHLRIAHGDCLDCDRIAVILTHSGAPAGEQ